VAEQPAHDVRWAEWLLARNRRGTITLLWIVIVLYPLFGVLDYLIAPRDWLKILYATRIVVSVVTLAMFRLVRTRAFERHSNLLSSSYLILASCGISLMTVRMGGLASSYYAGLSLAIVAAGLLFVWPRHVVIGTHAAIVASFLVPNLIVGARLADFAAVSNLFFLVSTAVIAGAGQLVGFRAHREQVTSQLVIETTNLNLEKAHARLKELDRFKSEFFANITHELKTPLTMILAPLELMSQGEMGKLTEAQRASLESMLRSGVKLLKLIGDLLDLSKLDESRLRLQIADHDMVGYLRGLVAQVEPLAQRKSIDLSFQANVERSVVAGDLDRLERVFVNLLSNAAKFTRPKGNIRVALIDQGESVRIEVRDTGVGFPPEMADRLFERFFQVDMTGTRKFGGTGIGLSLARELVELHGGKIRAQSDGLSGATFIVELRKGRDHLDAERIDRRERQEDRISGNRKSDHSVGEWQVESESRYRLIDIDEATEQRVVNRDPDEHQRPQSVLVVEDTPDVIRVIHLALRGHFRVYAASDGQKGFELALRCSPSLVITDLMMPVMDGMELSRKLRADPRTQHTPIVMLTARNDTTDRIAGFESGVNAYLPKPFSAKELLSTVRGLVKFQETAADLLMAQNMDSLETFAGGLAHEINNPLNYIKNALWLIRTDSEALVESVRAYARGETGGIRVEDLTTRMNRMYEVADIGLRRIGTTVELMRRYSREGYTRTLQSFDLFESARDVAWMLQAGSAAPVIETTFEGDGVIECVPEELNQVLTNLIQNAIDAIPSGRAGRVRVLGKGEPDALVLSVEDNGSGIRTEDRTKIFTPFFTTKEVGKGMGLGLTIVHRVITAHRGTVSVRSEEGVGTEFTLRVPRAASRSPGPSACSSQPGRS